jgi:hypothetical protein
LKKTAPRAEEAPKFISISMTSAAFHFLGKCGLSIPKLDPAVRRYLLQFDLACIALTRDRRLISTTDPSGVEAAWWCRASDIGVVLRRARLDHGDVQAAAAGLGMRLVEHAHAVQRAHDCVCRLDARLSHAQRGGDLQFFNREFRQRRLLAQAEGRPFMPYTAAKARLRKALLGVAAGDRPGLIACVFGPQ